MMEYKGYQAQVQFDDQANIFYGEVANTRDVITFQGQTVDELRQAFHESVDDYLDFCAERGEAPETPFSGRLTVHVSPAEHKRLLEAASQAGKDIESWAAEVLGRAAG